MSRLVKVALIDRSPWADLFDHPEGHIAQLAEDIAERGIQTPLHVYPRDKRYELLTGHDRLDAAMRCGLDEVPVDVRTTLTDEDDRFAYFLKDNTLRKDVDRRAAAEAAIRRHPDWSIRMLADLSGCSTRMVHEVRHALEVKEPQLFPCNTVGKDGVAQPAHKPKPAPLPSRRKDGMLNPLDAMRRMREAQAAGSAAFEVGDAAEPKPEPPAHNDPARPSAKPDRSKLVPPRRPYTARMKALIAAAQDAADASDDEIAGVPTNDLMIHGLRNARDLLDRIIARHSPKERIHVSS